MKYCKYCGAQMNDGDAVCPSCGRAAETQPTHSARYNTGTQTAAKVFMIISCVLYALLGIIMMTVAFWVGIIYWIPLCWVVAYDSCIQQFDKRHETARRVGFQNLCVAVCQPDCGYIDALRQ